MDSIYSNIKFNCFSFSSIFIKKKEEEEAGCQEVETINNAVLIFRSDSWLFNLTVISGKIFQLLRTVT